MEAAAVVAAAAAAAAEVWWENMIHQYSSDRDTR